MNPSIRHQIIKYFCVGGVVVAINVSVLYALTEFLHIYYIVSAISAFAVSFSVSFFLQKFFTFADQSKSGMAFQMGHYLVLQLLNVSMNTLLLYVLVEYFGLWYILSQMLISLALAVITFVIARRFIFVRPATATA